ncbi:MAG: ABC transporter permease [Gaiellaceae bacterium]
MLRYALARVVWTIPVVFVAVTLTFFLVRSIGGDPFRHGPLTGLPAQGGWQKYGDYQPQSIRDNMRRRYGLDLPWYEQYANYLGGVATFNLGPSLSYRNRTVEDIIATQGPVTLELSLLSLGFALVFGVPIGVASALHARSPVARLEAVTSSLALALPAFLVATLLIYVFAVRTDVVPTTGWDSWRAKILPTVTLGLVPLAYSARLTRGAVLETLRNDYVRTAEAKGLRRGRILVQHVLRNSLVPVLSAVGPLLGALVTTLFVVEIVFSVPGLARHYVSATTASDYPLLMGMTVVLTLFVITANLLVDLALAALDPRVRERAR